MPSALDAARVPCAADACGAACASSAPAAYDALVVIDVQTALVHAHPANEERFLAAVRAVVDACRRAGAPVVHVLHDGGPGDGLERGTAGWHAHPAAAPCAGEAVVHKRFNSAFRQTELQGLLHSLGARRLVLCGMQTEFCVDASVKVAFELGYDVTVPREAVTTFDGEFATGDALTAYFEDGIWNGRYAQVTCADDVVRAFVEGAR